MGKKIFVLMPDGVSLRNFAYTSFYKDGVAKGYEVVFWNSTPFDLEALGFPQRILKPGKLARWTDLLKAARIRVELALFEQRDNDPIYKGYLFPLSKASLKAKVKSAIIRFYVKRYGSEKGLNRLRERIKRGERSTAYYEACKAVLEKEKPDLLYCASQRSVQTIAPLLAAQALGIPTAAFIFSWDNVPKATTIVETDYYFAWSDLMKEQLLHYNQYIENSQILVTGTPQFSPHYDQDIYLDRSIFCKQIGVAPDDKLICFSGDDFTTSPKDELYLRDVASAARSLKESGLPVKIVFRRCPVDFSERYAAVISEYSDVIVEVPPLWKRIGDGWNTILPTLEDIHLQVNLMRHCEGVINLGSSMVFDAVAHKKPCAYMNYNYLNVQNEYTHGVYVYDFVHFRSMPSKEAVLWLEHPESITDVLQQMLDTPETTVKAAQDWFDAIHKQPAHSSSDRIWNGIDKILNKQPITNNQQPTTKE